jgi:Escherichia/Staphylococcus phage prohead protease
MAAAVERRYTLVPVELRVVGDKPRIGGYAAMFERVSQNLGGFVEVVERSFFNKSRGDGWPDVMARYNHDDNMLLGTSGAGTLTLSLDETGLDYLVDPPQSRADVVELVQRGDVRKSSFAFRLPKEGDEWTMSDQGYPLRRLVTGQLVDVAPVNAPASLDTSAGLRSLAERMDADVDEVRSAAEVNELHRFFKVSSGAPMPKPKPRTFGAAAMVALLQRKEDPWE